ncbi:alkaline phosphatase D family protein [Pontibacter cellulosilyticus]|uniref:Alkaline phosphatase family protein n=1 Tax=Pontibacter cellulosilyticus TaxID=1720253 RepID=A0A923N897_9BACT|nr:alkaline phosphatase D family protein [Pontibacter cellulosilyticus]MBC5992702.1 alkaline phosphatase family protein [Pontibacter cellulosilyticus]
MLHKYTYFRLLAFTLLLLSACQKPATTTQTQDSLTTLAFGSCNREDLPQPLWQPIIQNKPQVWVWLGDNIYGDSDTMVVLQRKYNMVLQEPGYQQLQQEAKVIGVWDDHDYGKNDAGKEYKMKEESAQLFWDFIGEPANSPRRRQEGVYSAHTYGPAGKQVKVILLDSRYHRDSLVRINRVYQTNYTGDILGEEQWRWLEQELRNSTASINIIGNGIQILPEEQVFEKWANFPKARKRLLDLIAASNAKGVILVSGDRHIAEISKTTPPGMSYPLYEVTSSGMTHVYSGNVVEPNKYRVGDLIKQLNFGVLNFHWNDKQVKVEMLIKGEENKNLLEHTVTY